MLRNVVWNLKSVIKLIIYYLMAFSSTQLWVSISHKMQVLKLNSLCKKKCISWNITHNSLALYLALSVMKSILNIDTYVHSWWWQWTTSGDLAAPRLTDKSTAGSEIHWMHLYFIAKVQKKAAGSGWGVISLGVEEVSFKKIQRNIGLFKTLRRNGKVWQPFTSGSSLYLFIRSHFVQMLEMKISEIK